MLLATEICLVDQSLTEDASCVWVWSTYYFYWLITLIYRVDHSLRRLPRFLFSRTFREAMICGFCFYLFIYNSFNRNNRCFKVCKYVAYLFSIGSCLHWVITVMAQSSCIFRPTDIVYNTRIDDDVN